MLSGYKIFEEEVVTTILMEIIEEMTEIDEILSRSRFSFGNSGFKVKK